MQMRDDDRSAREFLALEEKYWNAIRQKDASTAASLSGDPCIVVGAQGVGELDRETLAGMMKNARYELQDFSLGDLRVRMVTDDVVVVAYKVKEDLTVDGDKVNLEAFDSSVWVRRDGKWVCAVHTESIAGDPFGRH